MNVSAVYVVNVTESVANRVYQLAYDRVDGQQPDLSHIAEVLGMSSRTLRRHLQSEGTSFSSIIQAVLLALAKDKLAGSDSIQCIAYDLGFSEPSAFSRAFRRWTAVSPNVYRKTLREG